MRLFRPRASSTHAPSSDGFRYWPPCPSCGAPLGCVARKPENAVPAATYTMRCNAHGHQSTFTHAEILAVQDEQAKSAA